MMPSTPVPPNLNFQKLFELAPAKYIVLLPDEQFTIVAVSDDYLAVSMRKREDLIGKGLFEAFPDNPDDPTASGERNLRASLAKVVLHHAPDTMATQKYDILRPESEGNGFEVRYWCPMSTPVVNKDGKLEYIIHRVEDVTEYMLLKNQRSEENLLAQAQSEKMEAEIFNRMKEIERAKADLEASNAKYTALTEIAPVGIFNTNSDALCSFVNPKWQEITGNRLEEIGKLPWYTSVHPDDKERVLARWEHLKTTGEKFEATFRFLRPDGQEKWVLCRIISEPVTAKSIISYTGSITDITERKQQEEQQVKMLAEIDSAKTAFFNNVSHELRTPLTLILGPLEASLKSETQPLTPEQHTRQMVIYQNALRLLKLVNSLLDFSRIEASRDKANFEPVNFSKLTQDHSSVFQSLFAKAGLDFIIDAPPLDEEVYIDKGMYEKIIFNLLSNAFKYTLEGSVKVSVKKHGEYIELSVQDTGLGIPTDEIPHLFERFHRVESARGRSYEGTGIGLALIKELIKLHGGEIEVVSKMGIGSTFIVKFRRGKEHLPVEQLAKAESHILEQSGTSYVEEAMRWLPTEKVPAPIIPVMSKSPVAPVPTSLAKDSDAKPLIMIVDDCADLRKYLYEILSPLWDIIMAGDGEEALTLVNMRVPDLILSDVMMPKLDGYQLIKRLKSHPETQFIPVILLTAKAGEENCLEGLEKGADDYVNKPFSSNVLIARIKTHLDLAHLHRQLKAKLQELENANAIIKAEYEQRMHIERQLTEEHTRIAAAIEYRQKTSDFIDTLCHEIRNPLHAIYGSLPILMDILKISEQLLQAESIRLGTAATEQLHLKLAEAEELARAMSYCAQHQKVLLDDVLTLSKFDSGLVELNPAPFELKQLVEAVCKMHHMQFVEKRQEFILNLPEPSLWLKADQHQLLQVLANVLGHAIKFTGQGGTISLTIEPKNISTTETMLNFKINDTAIGMSTEEVSRIFDRFTQANRRVATEHKDSGLGLVLSKAIIERMGGSITVNSLIDRGTEYCFNVKCAQLTEEENAEIAVRQKRPASLSKVINLDSLESKKILVVDDELTNQKIMVNHLKKIGCECVVANNGIEALEKYQLSHYDLILTDIGMPLMDGLELTRQVRALEKETHRHTPIIGCSAYTSAEKKVEASEKGMDDYLTKPFARKDLYEIIARHIGTNTKPSQIGEVLAESIIPHATLQGNLPSVESPLIFTEVEISRDGNCGFTVLGKTREEVAVTIKDLVHNVEDRELLMDEIEEALTTELWEGPSNEWRGYLSATQDLDAALQRVLKIGNQPDLAESLNRAAQEQRTLLEEYCKRPDVFHAYLNRLRIDIPEQRLWLGYKTAMLYAKANHLTLYIWAKSETHPEQLILKASHIPKQPSGQIIHGLHTDRLTHFNLLVEHKKPIVARSYPTEPQNGHLTAKKDKSSTPLAVKAEQTHIVSEPVMAPQDRIGCLCFKCFRNRLATVKPVSKNAMPK